MRIATGLGMAVLPIVCFAQTADTVQKQLLEETKGVRATLDRLVNLVEAIERSQRAVLALQQMQVYSARLGALEGQRDALAKEERDLGAQAARLGQSARALDSGVGPTGAPGAGAPDAAQRSDLAERLAVANRRLDDTRARQRSVDREITALRERLALLEKALDEVLPK